MHVMHKEGLNTPEWGIVKKLNENLKAKIHAKHGETRAINTKDGKRQEGVLSVGQYALLMDEINKEMSKQNPGTCTPDLEETIGRLLWLDDVVLTISDPK